MRGSAASGHIAMIGFAAAVSGSYPMGAIAYMQTWIQDPAGTNPFAATNATRAELIKP